MAILLFPTILFGQVNAIKFKILPYFSVNQRSIADTTFELKKSSDFKIDALRFYISNIRFYKKDSLVYQEKNSVHLFDAANLSSNHFMMDKSESVAYDKVKFDLGIDSITNVSGAMGGALDPTNGMYWAWQSGYINFKLEGRSPICETRNHEFQYHLGGYMSPYNALQTVTFDLMNIRDIVLVIDIDHILNNVNLSKQNHIMSPSIDAVKLSKIVAESFRCNQ